MQKIEYIDIDLIKSHPNNPRIIKDEQFKKLCQSIKDNPDYFETRPILVNKDMIIFAGNMRWKAGKEIGLKKVPISIMDISEQRQKELMIRDNRENGEWDFDILANNFEINDLLEWGFDENELNFDLSTPKDDVIPEISTKTDIKQGDMFALGHHRLLCSDCTTKSNIERLMDGNKADICLTDPPYGLNIVGGGGKTHFKGTVGGGGIVPANLYSKMVGDETTETAKKVYQILTELGINKLIIWGGNYMTDFLPLSSCWIVWDKRVDIPSNNFSDCEMAWTNFNKPARIVRYKWSGLLREGSRDIELTKRVHPTQKPVGMLIEILKMYSKRNDIVLDIFGGSGSTLIACQKTNRKCFMMEISEMYCEVIATRYENFTGNKRIKL